VASAEPVVQTDYAQFGSIAEFREYLKTVLPDRLWPCG